MNPKYEKLKTLLKELLQLDQPDLDFGLYRIMHAKSAEVTQFLDRDLLPQVRAELAGHESAEVAEAKQALAERIELRRRLGDDPEKDAEVARLKQKIAEAGMPTEQLEAEVYDHLFGFFRRYYSEGDFLSKRVYKPGVYAIPYEGEEVKLHWANADQYYIKTSEYLRDYAFRLRPDDGANPMRVHFQLVDAVEGEHGNVKPAQGKDRVFVLAANDFLAEQPGEQGEQGQELAIRFEYRPATLADWPDDVREGKTKPPTQKELTEIAERRISVGNGLRAVPPSVGNGLRAVPPVDGLPSPSPRQPDGLGRPSSGLSPASLDRWLTELSKPHTKSDGERADYSRLRAHLNRYVARNTFDYFIHKDLGGFLRRELDFFIKNEVMHLDDVENESVPRVEQYLSKIKVIRRIAGKIIDFLAQLEDFQKKLWLKKKFVVETQYCIAVGIVPDEFLPEIIANDAQWQEWESLHSLSATVDASALFSANEGALRSASVLKSHPTLMIDSRHFAGEFFARLLTNFSDVNDQTDGVLLHGENFQALSLIEARYRECVNCVYIDPPYNTGDSEIPYKNTYLKSCWLTLMSNRLSKATPLLGDDPVIFIAIDDFEMVDLSTLIDSHHPFLRREMIIVNHHPQGGKAKTLAHTHEYMLACVRNDSDRTLAGRMTDGDTELRPFKRSGTADSNFRHSRPNSFYAILIDPSHHEVVGVSPPPPPKALPTRQMQRPKASHAFIRSVPLAKNAYGGAHMSRACGLWSSASFGVRRT